MMNRGLNRKSLAVFITLLAPLTTVSAEALHSEPRDLVHSEAGHNHHHAGIEEPIPDPLSYVAPGPIPQPWNAFFPDGTSIFDLPVDHDSVLVTNFSQARRYLKDVKGRIHRGRHMAIDLAPTGGGSTPVFASADGIVQKVIRRCPNSGAATCGSGFGNHVIIEHPQAGGIKTLYAHLAPGGGPNSNCKINLKKGTKIKKGQQIGCIGNSGASTGPHLCFRFLHPDGKTPIRPETFMAISLFELPRKTTAEIEVELPPFIHAKINQLRTTLISDGRSTQ